MFQKLSLPGDTPAIITRYVAWMEIQFNACQTPRSMYPSSTVSQLFEPQVQIIAVFAYCSPHFCSPWRRPCDYHAICCMDGKTIQCLPNPSQHVLYLSIFNSFRVIRCLSQCVSPKVAILPHFCFPWGCPWGNHAKCCILYRWKENLVLINCLAVCAHLVITVSEIQRDIGRKSSIFSYPPCIRRPH